MYLTAKHLVPLIRRKRMHFSVKASTNHCAFRFLSQSAPKLSCSR